MIDDLLHIFDTATELFNNSLNVFPTTVVHIITYLTINNNKSVFFQANKLKYIQYYYYYLLILNLSHIEFYKKYPKHEVFAYFDYF